MKTFNIMIRTDDRQSGQKFGPITQDIQHGWEIDISGQTAAVRAIIQRLNESRLQ